MLTICDVLCLLLADFLHDYIFLTVGRVGSSTDLIAQHVEYVQQDQKRETVLDCVKMVDVSSCAGTSSMGWLDALQLDFASAAARQHSAQAVQRVKAMVGVQHMSCGIVVAPSLQLAVWDWLLGRLG
jgi:hypothetical protein